LDRSLICYPKLTKKILSIYGTQSNFAAALGISKQSLSKKLTKKTDFTIREIKRWCDLLQIDYTDAPGYFFSDEV